MLVRTFRTSTSKCTWFLRKPMPGSILYIPSATPVCHRKRHSHKHILNIFSLFPEPHSSKHEEKNVSPPYD